MNKLLHFSSRENQFSFLRTN
jgi:hypothetical protein